MMPIAMPPRPMFDARMLHAMNMAARQTGHGSDRIAKVRFETSQPEFHFRVVYTPAAIRASASIVWNARPRLSKPSIRSIENSVIR